MNNSILRLRLGQVSLNSCDNESRFFPPVTRTLAAPVSN